MRLVIMRHAKAEDWNQAGDHARHLTEQGRSRARTVGELLAPMGIDQALVSTAARTRETFESLGVECDVHLLDELYDAFGDPLPDLLDGVLTPAEAVGEALLIVGHVPAVQMWAARLAHRAGDEQLAHDLARWFPTATAACFDLSGLSVADYLAGEEPTAVTVLDVIRR